MLIAFCFRVFYFFSCRVVVHYKNIDNPLTVNFLVEKRSQSDYLKDDTKSISKGSISFNKPFSLDIGPFYSMEWATLTISDSNRKKISEVDMLEDVNYNACKIDVFLDANGQVEKVIETDNTIPFLCF
ncbi:TPA: hypothetical protein ACX6PS_002665 [Photobacterium damselae]